MLQVRCQRCGWVLTLSRDSIGLAVAEAEAAHAEYHQEPCPKCRNAVKIQVKELRRRLPPDYILPAPPAKPEPIHVKKEEAPKPAPPAPPKPALVVEAKPKPAKAESKPKAATKPALKAKQAAKPKTTVRRALKK